MDRSQPVPLILTLDNSGRPIDWLHWQDVVTLYVREQVAWTASETTIRIYGGINQLSGLQSYIDLNTIIAIRGANAKHYQYILILGPQELEQQSVTLRNMKTGKQELIPLKKIHTKIPS